MKNSEVNIIAQFKRKWLLIYLLETMLMSTGVTLIVAATSLVFEANQPIIYAITALSIAFPGFYWGRNNKRITVENVLRLLNTQDLNLEHSADLLLKDRAHLTSLEVLQLVQVRQRLLDRSTKLRFPNMLKTSLAVFGVSVIVFLSSKFLNFGDKPTAASLITPVAEQLIASASAVDDRGVESIKITIIPPRYTGRQNIVQEDTRDITAPEGSLVKWEFRFYENVTNVKLRLSDKRELLLKSNDDNYSTSFKITERMFYELLYTNDSGQIVYSDFYKIDIILDLPPTVKLTGLDQYTQIEYDQDKVFDLSAQLSDDYGLSDAYIIATIAQGSGESVMFREEKIDFDRKLKASIKKSTLPKRFDLNKMEMQPGDELYFYVETKDNSTIKNNRSRTETYIISIRDTSTFSSNMEGGLGIDMMPEYFRSQRQIIIDTEKLLAGKLSFSTRDFNAKSNELGFDQKQLRLKYGQFLGVEDESGIAIENHDEGDHEDEMVGEDSEEDVLDGYKHDHDSEDEHSRVNDGEEQEEDPLEAYQHAHDSEDVATFFTNTLKGKLKAAMSLMWDAELYLRLYQPQNSLPYQYKALKLIKEIKNHARVYVHRIGFDPPPIKEETRLSGDLAEVISNKLDAYDTVELYPNIRRVISVLRDTEEHMNVDKEILQQAGVELAKRALDNPGRFLNGLQILRTWINDDSIDSSAQIILRNDLIQALPNERFVNEGSNATMNDLSRTYLRILETNNVNDER